MEQFASSCIEQINDPNWHLEEPNMKKKQLYKTLLQPTINTWLQKLAITHHLKQTTKKWHIHNMNQQKVQIYEQEWIKHWRTHKTLHGPTETNIYEMEISTKQYLYLQKPEK